MGTANWLPQDLCWNSEENGQATERVTHIPPETNRPSLSHSSPCPTHPTNPPTVWQAPAARGYRHVSYTRSGLERLPDRSGHTVVQSVWRRGPSHPPGRAESSQWRGTGVSKGTELWGHMSQGG